MNDENKKKVKLKIDQLQTELLLIYFLLLACKTVLWSVPYFKSFLEGFFSLSFKWMVCVISNSYKKYTLVLAYWKDGS